MPRKSKVKITAVIYLCIFITLAPEDAQLWQAPALRKKLTSLEKLPWTNTLAYFSEQETQSENCE